MNYDPAADKINRDAGVVSAQPVAAYEVRTIAAAPTAHNVAPQYHAQGRATAVRPMQNRWKDSIFAQKVGYSTFANPVGAFVVIWIVAFILTGIFGSAYFIVLMPLFFAFFFSIGLRLHIVNRDNLTDNGGCFGEFCCGFWCWYCSVAQMARHVYGYTKVLDGDGDPDRPDNYAPIHNV
eukprot:gene10231-11975_t